MEKSCHCHENYLNGYESMSTVSKNPDIRWHRGRHIVVEAKVGKAQPNRYKLGQRDDQQENPYLECSQPCTPMSLIQPMNRSAGNLK